MGSRKKGSTMDRVFKAALKEFAAYGYDGARVDRIAASAGINKAMIYYHFENKGALYEEVLMVIYEDLYKNVTALSVDSNDVRDRIYAFIEHLVRYIDSLDTDFFRILLRELARGGEYYKKLTIPKLIMPMISYIIPLVNEATDKKLIHVIDHFYTMFQIVGGIIMFNMLKEPTKDTELHRLLYRNDYLEKYIQNLFKILKSGIEIESGEE